jgi:hypothetical protein
MIASCSMTFDNSLAYARPGKGASKTAGFIEGELGEFVEHYSRPRRQVLEPEIWALVGADPDKESVAVSDETARQAITFAMLLPKAAPIPEVAPDPDGEISFDWFGKAGKVFSISIGADGRISYAGRFSDKSKIHGIEQLSDACPPEILFGLEKVLR